jgi:hypothetical protein
MSGLEKALFNLKVRLSAYRKPADSLPTALCLRNTDTRLRKKLINMKTVHSEATQPPSSKSQQGREDREGQAQEGTPSPPSHAPRKSS